MIQQWIQYYSNVILYVGDIVYNIGLLGLSIPD